MKDWLASLEARERMFVVAGAVAVVLAILYGFVWAPLDREHDTMRASVDSWERALAEIQPLQGTHQRSPWPQPCLLLVACTQAWISRYMTV